MVLLLVLNALWLCSLDDWILHFFPVQLASLLQAAFVALMAIYLFNSDMDPTSKITWLALIAVMPMVGAPLYFYTQADVGHRLLKKRVAALLEQTRGSLMQKEVTMEKLLQDNEQEAALAKYLQKSGNHPVYDHCQLNFFPSGEAKFEELKQQLKTAEKFIFLEYFIVDEGRMWGEILEILAEKAKQGVNVRVMYDGNCEFITLPRNYPEKLQALGIQCRVFSPATPLVSTHYNYRDHRKIAVIDGKVAFTGGVNLADEYINEREKHGHWKDTALMIKGEAARSFTLMFLQMWNLREKLPEIGSYLQSDCESFPEEKGFVIPFADCPLDEYRVGERVYMDVLNRATRYVHIMSPYLILDGELETALCFAARRGVDVKLIFPGVPDKKIPYALAKTYYRPLMNAGVKIYEYKPGFVHAKTFVSDDRRGVVGTINLDYRSLYHHFECAAYLYDCSCLYDMEEDFQKTLEHCHPVSMEDLKNRPMTQKLCGWLMKVIAPLF